MVLAFFKPNFNNCFFLLKLPLSIASKFHWFPVVNTQELDSQIVFHFYLVSRKWVPALWKDCDKHVKVWNAHCFIYNDKNMLVTYVELIFSNHHLIFPSLLLTPIRKYWYIIFITSTVFLSYITDTTRH